jgi:hypothetical protein
LVSKYKKIMAAEFQKEQQQKAITKHGQIVFGSL